MIRGSIGLLEEDVKERKWVVGNGKKDESFMEEEEEGREGGDGGDGGGEGEEELGRWR